MSTALRLDAQTLLMGAMPGLASNACEKRPQSARQVDDRRQIDRLLVPLLQATDSADYEERLGRLLLDEAQPIINAIIKRKLRVSLSVADGRAENQDALEISGEIQARLLATLRRLDTDGSRSIGDFHSYVAVAAHHAYHEFLRRKYPQRHSLKNRLRYLIGRRSCLSLWESDGLLLCGMAIWRLQKKRPIAASQLRLLVGDCERALQTQAPGARLSASTLQPLLIELVEKADAPVELDALVGLVADLLGIKEAHQPEDACEEQGRCERLESFADEGPKHYLKLEGRLCLERLWSEVCCLPTRQRAALLLNLRDARGHGLIDLFPITGVATLRNLADALEMSAEELAGVWNELPLADDAIALRLKVTRQQVINLRKSARERLARRIKALWEMA